MGIFSRDFYHDCRQPNTASGTRGRWGEDYPFTTLLIVGTLLFTAVSIQGFLVWVTASGWNTDSTGFEVDGSKFPFYKNTIAEQCFRNSTSPTRGLCASFSRHLESQAREGLETFLDKRDFSWDDEMLGSKQKQNATWCQVLHCVKDFNVIPSEPLPSAFLPNRLASWSSGNAAVMVYFSTFMIYLYKRKYSYPKSCRGFKSIGFLEWISTAYAFAGAFVWWWVSVFRGWSNNTDYGTASFAAWTVTWYQVYSLHYRPRACLLAAMPRWLGRSIKGISWLLVVAQCVATAYFVIDWSFVTKEYMPQRGYDCLNGTSLASAPGSLSVNCTLDSLCSSPDKEWLLQARDFQQGERFFFSSIFPPVHFILSALAIALPYAWTLIKCIRDDEIGELSYETKEREEIPLYTMAGVAAVTLICSLVNVVMVARNHGATAMDERFGSVALDAECHAIHVGLSPWKHFLDVDISWRETWLAQAWMNG